LKVAVIGGGVVGLASALDLARHGAEVFLLERGECGSGASSGNCGWVTPALSRPLAEPGAVAHAVLGMTRPQSPFALRPRLDLAFKDWCWPFGRSSSDARWRRGAAHLLALNARTFQLFDELRARRAIFEMHPTWLLFAATTHRGLTALRALFQSISQLGNPGTVVEWQPAEAREHEPTLSDADAAVIAAGVWSRDVLRPHGIRLPLEAAKGYRITATGSGRRVLQSKHQLDSTAATRTEGVPSANRD
jgi:D-amino-acid dehydrogenase